MALRFCFAELIFVHACHISRALQHGDGVRLEASRRDFFVTNKQKKTGPRHWEDQNEGNTTIKALPGRPGLPTASMT